MLPGIFLFIWLVRLLRVLFLVFDRLSDDENSFPWSGLPLSILFSSASSTKSFSCLSFVLFSVFSILCSGTISLSS